MYPQVKRKRRECLVCQETYVNIPDKSGKMCCRINLLAIGFCKREILWNAVSLYYWDPLLSFKCKTSSISTPYLPSHQYLDSSFIISIISFKKNHIQPLPIAQLNSGLCYLRTGLLSALLNGPLVSSLLTSNPSWLVILGENIFQGFPRPWGFQQNIPIRGFSHPLPQTSAQTCPPDTHLNRIWTPQKRTVIRASS